MNTERVIEALEYLISGDCTDTQMDYADEIAQAVEFLRRPEHQVCTNCPLQPVRIERRDGKTYCGYCGKRIPEKIKARFCHKCGRMILWAD